VRLKTLSRTRKVGSPQATFLAAFSAALYVDNGTDLGKNGVVKRVAIAAMSVSAFDAAPAASAERLEEHRKREVKAGTYEPQFLGPTKVGTWLAYYMPLRKNRSAENEQALIEAHVLTVEWFVAMDIKTVRPKHILRLVEAMRSAGKLAEKSIATVYSIVHGAFKRALFEDVISDDPCILPPKTIKWKSRNKRTPYTRSEAHALTTSAKVTLATRVWNTLAFYTGMRKGEICGRRWRDWARDARPLSALSVHSQYDDQPLKGDDDDQTLPRLVPVHPALEDTLRYWWSEGFEFVYLYRDVVIFETPPSNVVAVSKRTQPNRSIGVGHLAAGLFLDAAALWLAMKANEFPEGSRGDVYTISGGMVVASVPLLALGTYMLTKPAQTARLW
jgi:integrase